MKAGVPPPPAPEGRLEARVRGIVQGVGFRYATVRQAHLIGGLTGCVWNASDGSVHVVAEGTRNRLQKLEAWLRQGPPGSRVRSLDAEYLQATGEWGSFGVATRG